MYITSDLFGGASTHARNDTSVWNQCTVMADSPHAAGLGKRKRLDGEDTPSGPCIYQQRPSPASRGYTRFHAHNASACESNRSLTYPVFSALPLYTASDRRPVKQVKRHSPKATLVKSTSHLMDMEYDLPPSIPKAETHTHTASDLRPCHACKSAPKRKKDLENYLDCRRCDGRTCYICARQCFGGCGKAVCKKCIVEVGEEGDPWCLDCYARSINT
ncbi:hypothetical protein FB567DRAFT_444110 [Paraphoma chrysanthemicola]|uniref:Uncharacterized protein n=1 Tax=Paraphoma chrysanthemicola TaxID=798071 RepID=A0A8K0R4I1_9PLEO|nr:hypothetical protein FB567DRAFT_444110 [Paraphoma chrysanthemicola]